MRYIIVAWILINAPVAIMAMSIPLQKESVLQNEQANAATNMLHILKQGIVTINTNVMKSAYSPRLGGGGGSGFLLDIENGIIATNAHVAAATDTIQEIFVTFANGKKVLAEILYEDPTQDLSIIKVNPEEIPEGCTALVLAASDVELEENVTIISNSENNDFSIQHGIINSLYTNVGFANGQYLAISVNIAGGSSGSAVLNKDGQVVGIVFAGNGTFVHAIPAKYLADSLEYAKKSQIPLRKSIGAKIDFSPLDDVVRYYDFPQEVADLYLKQKPHFRNLVLAVMRTINGTHAASSLKAGDIIWAINGKELGADLYQLQNICNYSTDETVRLTVYRKGVKKEIVVKLYDANQSSLKRVLLLAGAVFFESDDAIRNITDIPLHSVLVRNIDQGSPFEVFPGGGFQRYGYLTLSQIIEIDGVAIKSLDDIIKLLPQLQKKKYFCVLYKNFVPYQSFNATPVLDRSIRMAGISYSANGSVPTMFEYKNHIWNSQSYMD